MLLLIFNPYSEPLVWHLPFAGLQPSHSICSSWHQNLPHLYQICPINMVALSADCPKQKPERSPLLFSLLFSVTNQSSTPVILAPNSLKFIVSVSITSSLSRFYSFSLALLSSFFITEQVCSFSSVAPHYTWNKVLTLINPYFLTLTTLTRDSEHTPVLLPPRFHMYYFSVFF